MAEETKGNGEAGALPAAPGLTLIFIRFQVLFLTISLVAFNHAAKASGPIEQTPYAGPVGGYSNPKKNLAEFLVEFRCLDPNATDPSKCVASPRMANTIVNWRRTDWGSGGVPYYQVSEDYLSDDGGEILQTFSYAPFGAFNAENGDGGQVSFTDGISVRILGTQDGSVPYFQNFVGQGCGGQGWIQVNLKVGISGYLPQARIYGNTWDGQVDYLNISRYANACPLPLNSAYDVWTVDNITFPFIVFGTPEQRIIPTIVTEHFDNADDKLSTYMEREFLGSEYGMLRWEAWESPAGTRVSSAINQRCPVTSISGSNYGPPFPGWKLYDCRNWTNIISAANWTGDDFGWRP